MTFYKKDPQLEEIGEQILKATWREFPALARNQIAMTWLVYDPGQPINTGGAIASHEFWQYTPRGFGYRGLELFYPASIVKLFYLVAIHEWLERRMVQSSTELERAIKDMITVSSNDATSLVVDVLTGTTSGPELPVEPFQTWQWQRNIVNRYFQAWGWPEFEGININQKTWGDGPYGRERLFLGEERQNRNKLTTDATARLVHGIVGGVAVSAARSQQMLALMHRPLNQQTLTDDQTLGFLGEGLPRSTKIWSKAGWTSQVRHDAAYLEIPNCLPSTLVVFTDGAANSQNEQLFPFIAEQIAGAIQSGKINTQ